jgi:hypothetical protein
MFQQFKKTKAVLHDASVYPSVLGLVFSLFGSVLLVYAASIFRYRALRRTWDTTLPDFSVPLTAVASISTFFDFNNWHLFVGFMFAYLTYRQFQVDEIFAISTCGAALIGGLLTLLLSNYTGLYLVYPTLTILPVYNFLHDDSAKLASIYLEVGKITLYLATFIVAPNVF